MRRPETAAIVLPAIALLLTGLAGPGPESEPSPSSRPTCIAVPFELVSNKPFVPVRVNGSRPLWFILDTGAAGGCAIDRDRARELDIEIRGEQRVHVGAGEGTLITVGHATAVNLDVSGAKLENQRVLVLPLSHVAMYEGHAVDGLLGRSFMDRYVVEIDYTQRLVNLYDPEAYEHGGSGQCIPFQMQGGFVVVPLTIGLPDGRTLDGDFIVDTGVRTTLVFNRPFVKENRLLRAAAPAKAATIGGGAGGESKGILCRIGYVQLGPYRINQPVAVFSLDQTGALASREFAGIIGGQILRRCKVVFDYTHQQLILDPYVQTPKPYEYDMSGMFLVAEGPDFKQFTIKSVMEDSPAAEAGLRRGDVITAIDGRPAIEFTLEDARTLFTQERRTCTLSIQRGDQQVQVAITMRRLL